MYYQKALKIEYRVFGVNETQVDKKNIDYPNIQNAKRSINICTNHMSELDKHQNLESSLSMMVVMGFLDIDVNREALQIRKGTIFKAMEYLEEKKEQSQLIIAAVVHL